jgi:hypothetical protein
VNPTLLNLQSRGLTTIIASVPASTLINYPYLNVLLVPAFNATDAFVRDLPPNTLNYTSDA